MGKTEATPKEAYEAASKVFDLLGTKWTSFEEIVIKSPEYAERYAENIIKGRFEEGEKAISEDSEASFRYALFVIKARFLLGEHAISTDEKRKQQYNEHFKCSI